MNGNNTRRNVCVIGGGIAGLSAAVFLKDKDFDVTLIEASPKLGGRAYSFFDNTIKDVIDNGQHILASWYTNTFEYLGIIGTINKLTIQKQLEVKFVDSEAHEYSLKCPKLPPPLHLIAGIMKYAALRFKDKFGIIRLVNSVIFKRFTAQKLRSMNTDEFFDYTKQSKRLIDYFWKPFIIAVFNAEPEETSAWLFAEILKLGFLKKGGSNLVLPDDFLSNLYVEPGIRYLEENKAKVQKSTRVNKINFKKDIIESIVTSEENEIKADFYISAVPFFDFKNLVGEDVYNSEFSEIDNLKYSPIVNIHHRYEPKNGEMIKDSFVGVLNSPIQWIFRVKADQICIVISSANKIAEMDKDEIIELSKKELCKCLPVFNNVKFISSKVIKEKRATFVPDKKSLNSRPGNKTNYKNFFIAGDWTDTHLPATFEGAVKSSRNCVNEILKLVN